MKALAAQPSLAEQVYEAILSEISAGRFQPGERLIQEQLAAELGVSRQPVQQALAMLRNQRMLLDAPGRGLIVAPLDASYVEHLYDLRAVIEGLACRRAAELNAARAAQAGPALIRAGREAVASGSVARMAAMDTRFHQFIYELSENPLIVAVTETQWVHMRRIMGEVLLKDETPRNIWDQHAEILAAIGSGDAAAAETLGRRHIARAAAFMVARLRRRQEEA